jgi:hypothetical protein
MLQVRERAPTPSPSNVFTFGLAIRSIRSLEVRHQGYHKLSKPPNPTELGKFGGGTGELGAHGDGIMEFHIRVAITAPHFFSFFLHFYKVRE